MLVQVQRQRSKFTLERVRRKSVRMALILQCLGPGSSLRARGSFAEILCDFGERGRVLQYWKDTGGNLVSWSFSIVLAQLGFLFREVSEWSPRFLQALRGQDCHTAV